MEISFGKFEDVPLTDEMLEVFQGLFREGAGWDEYVEYLSSLTLLFVHDKGVFQGFATYEAKEPNFVESHFYFPKSSRRYTVKLMKMLTERTHEIGRVPFTTVTGDYPHIKRCLELLGFRVIRVDKGIVKKETGVFDLYYLTHTKNPEV